MAIGFRFYELNEKERSYIFQGISLMSDLIKNDLKALFEGIPFRETFLAGFLPPGYFHRYDPAFIKQFYDVILALAYKMNDQEYLWRLNSVAEELAMNAILEEARVVAESYNEQMEMAGLYNHIFEDFDFKLLLDPRFDGIENDEEFNAEMGTVNLKFKDWFKPFRADFKMRVALKRQSG